MIIFRAFRPRRSNRPAWPAYALAGALILVVAACGAGTSSQKAATIGAAKVDHSQMDHAATDGTTPAHTDHVPDPAAPPGTPPPNHNHAPAPPTDPTAPPTTAPPDHHHPPTPPPTTPPGPNPGPPPPPPPPTGPIITLDDPRLTQTQRDAAVKLVIYSIVAMQKFSDVASVEAAGYRTIGDSSTGFEHFVNWSYFSDSVVLDPDRVESIVFQVNPDGSRTLVSAMYILPLGQTMTNVPDIAAELTTWHDHQNLCWDLTGTPHVVGVTDANGNCTQGQFIATPPMLHVWMTPVACGPFAGIEGVHGDSCGVHGH